MRWNINPFLILLLFTIVLSACTDDTVEPIDAVPTEIHYFESFSNHSVYLDIDGTRAYSATLGQANALTGFLAFFKTTLTRSEHTIRVFWSDGITFPGTNDTVSITIGPAAAYWIGFNIIADTLEVTVGEGRFGYGKPGF